MDHTLDAFPFLTKTPVLIHGRMHGKTLDLESRLLALEMCADAIQHTYGKVLRIERRRGYALVFLDEPGDS